MSSYIMLTPAMFLPNACPAKFPSYACPAVSILCSPQLSLDLMLAPALVSILCLTSCLHLMLTPAKFPSYACPS